MSGKAAKVVVTEAHQAILRKLAQAKTVSQQLMQGAQLILLALGGALNVVIASEVGLHRKQVGLWSRRWKQSFDALVAIEYRESRAMLRRAIDDVLSDAPRNGTAGKFAAEEVTLILTVAGEPPDKCGRPIDYCTGRELADEVVKRGIVDSVSVSQVNRYLAEAALQPHRLKYWLNTTEKDHTLFEQQVQTVCDCYLEAPTLYFQYHPHTVCVDEMMGIQALERNAQAMAMKAGQPERIEFEYTRHGTLCLIENWHVVLGQVIAPTIREQRKEEDFLWHIHNTIATDVDAGWLFVMDNLNTHASESLVRYVAQLKKIAENTLGQKGRYGILKSVGSRQAFLSDRAHRVRFVYLPKHTSWLNPIVTVFGVVIRRALRRGNFKSVEALRERLRDFIDYFNRTFAKPFRWTYTARPLAKEKENRPPLGRKHG